MRDLNDGRLITFSAFVPFRYDQFDLKIVKSAEESGVLGLKFYPPSGYSAFVERLPDKPQYFRGIIYQGGARKQWDRRYNALDSSVVRNNWDVTITEPARAREQTLEGVSARFFEFSQRRKLLVFSHHTPQGFEGYKGYGERFAEPCDWLPVLQRAPRQRLILGHSGGDSWYGNDTMFNRSFARQAFNLCVTYENVYCDFGYHEDVLTDAGKNVLRNRLQTMHELPAASRPGNLSSQSCRSEQAAMKYSIFNKIMYGSDWMMVIKEPNYEKMVTAFDAVFTGDLAQYKANFFGGNAIAILKKSGNANLLPKPLK
jgi:predicted TIM-barrel fold metal-dependent hydrolase